MESAIEWDEAKRQATLSERGLDFADVALVDWDVAVTFDDQRKPYAEPRFITFALIRDRLCVVAWCWRGTATRVISLRKANAREERRHAQAQTLYR